MDNTNQPPGGEPQDFWPTQEIRPATGQPGQPGQPSGSPGAGWDQPGQGRGWGQPPGPGQPAWGWPSGQPGHPGAGAPGPSAPSGPRAPRPPRRGRGLIWGAGLALVAVLAGGGAFAATQLAGSTSPAAAASGPTGQAAQLNSLLTSASSPASASAASAFAAGSSGSAGSAAATEHPCLARAARLLANGYLHAARVALERCRHPLERVRLLGGIHGQFTFKTKTGYKTLAYERGEIQSISGNDVTVQAVDGTTWTWVLVSNTVVRQGGQKVATSQLAEGQQVFAGGPIVSGVYDARLIVIRPASSSTPAPSPSPASGS
jgi:hypothetical protein